MIQRTLEHKPVVHDSAVLADDETINMRFPALPILRTEDQRITHHSSILSTCNEFERKRPQNLNTRIY